MTPAIPDSFSKSITIHTTTSKLWDALTRPELMKQWMPDDSIEIVTDWTINSSVIIRGNLHGHLFVNTGMVLHFEPLHRLLYTHLSSLSELPDIPESYTAWDFTLEGRGGETTLTVTCSNFPTESIYKHLLFYWNGTLGLIKKLLENKH